LVFIVSSPVLATIHGSIAAGKEQMEWRMSEI